MNYQSLSPTIGLGVDIHTLKRQNINASFAFEVLLSVSSWKMHSVGKKEMAFINGCQKLSPLQTSYLPYCEFQPPLLHHVPHIEPIANLYPSAKF